MIFIDANVFLSSSIMNDIFHDRAIQLFIKIETGTYGEYFTSDYVFNEIIVMKILNTNIIATFDNEFNKINGLQIVQ